MQPMAFGANKLSFDNPTCLCRFVLPGGPVTGTAGRERNVPTILKKIFRKTRLPFIVSKKRRCRVWMVLLVAAAGVFLCACAKRPAPPDEAPRARAGGPLFIAAERLFGQGAYDEALAAYQAYVAGGMQQPGVDAALAKIAAIYFSRGNYPTAREFYSQMIRRFPESPLTTQAKIQVLFCLYHEADYESLVETAMTFRLETLPRADQARGYALVGDAQMALGRFTEAVEAYGLGLFYAGGGEREAAEKRMEDAIGHLSAKDIEALLQRGRALPRDLLMYQLGRHYLQEDRDQAAHEMLTAFVAAYPHHPRADAMRAALARIDGKRDYNRFSIGCLLPMTGAYSSFGKRALRGIELAVSLYGQQFPEVPLQLVVKDTASDAMGAVSAVRELAEARVAAIIGPLATAPEAAAEAQLAGIPIVTFSGKEEIAATGPYVFSNFLTPRAQVQTLVAYLSGDLGVQRYAILYPDEKYGHTFMNLFWDEVISHGGIVVGCEPYPVDATDFADSIQKMVGLYYAVPESIAPLIHSQSELSEEVLSSGATPADTALHPPDGPFSTNAGALSQAADGAALAEELMTGEGDYHVAPPPEPLAVVDFEALFIPDAPKKAGLVVPQLAYHDVENVYFLGTNLWHSDEMIHMARRYVQNAIVVDGFFADSPLPVVRDFVDGFQAVFGMTPGFIEAIGYDTALMLCRLIGAGDIQFRSTIRERLLEMPPFEGVTGATTFSETGEALKQLYLLQIKGGEFRPLAPSGRRRSRP